MKRLSKPQPPLSERLRKFNESKMREAARYSASETPAARGHAEAIDVVRNMFIGLDADEDAVKSHLATMVSVLEHNRNTHIELMKLALARMEEPGADDEPTRMRDFHRAAVIEYQRLTLEVRNLLNPLPDDLL